MMKIGCHPLSPAIDAEAGHPGTGFGSGSKDLNCETGTCGCHDTGLASVLKDSMMSSSGAVHSLKM